MLARRRPRRRKSDGVFVSVKKCSTLLREVALDCFTTRRAREAGSVGAPRARRIWSAAMSSDVGGDGWGGAGVGRHGGAMRGGRGSAENQQRGRGRRRPRRRRADPSAGGDRRAHRGRRRVRPRARGRARPRPARRWSRNRVPEVSSAAADAMEACARHCPPGASFPGGDVDEPSHAIMRVGTLAAPSRSACDTCARVTEAGRGEAYPTSRGTAGSSSRVGSRGTRSWSSVSPSWRSARAGRAVDGRGALGRIDGGADGRGSVGNAQRGVQRADEPRARRVCQG